MKKTERHYIFATHGTFAVGLLNSVELILGQQANLHMLCAYTGGHEDLTQQVDKLMSQFTAQQELVVITDIFAGSVNNEFIRYLHRPDFHLIAGLNLPFVIEMLISNPTNNTEKLISEALNSAKENIQYCNQTVSKAQPIDNDF